MFLGYVKAISHIVYEEQDEEPLHLNYYLK